MPPEPPQPDPGENFSLSLALERFDAENSRDPNTEVAEGRAHPRELLYARRLSAWVARLCPAPSEALQLAARAQHLCRWMIPRSRYEMTRPGYHRWRTELRQFHAGRATEILHDLHCSEDLIRRVQSLVLKQNFPADPESRVLEDALCLVFLEHQLAGLAARTPADRVINALRKSWMKMTPAARQAALALNYGPVEKALLDQALVEASSERT